MVKRTYIGIPDPVRTFDELRPFYVQLRRLQGNCFPLKPDYEAFEKVLSALNDAATHFTRDQYFYGGEPGGQGPRPPLLPPPAPEMVASIAPLAEQDHLLQGPAPCARRPLR